jgi:membrane associated rhomboid family serine protease
MRIPRTATIIISIVTAACWLLTELLGASDRADIVFGVIPARLSGLIQLSPAAPAWLTPLTATLVHGNFLHLALNLLMLVWCGTQVERILGS